MCIATHCLNVTFKCGCWATSAISSKTNRIHDRNGRRPYSVTEKVRKSVPESMMFADGVVLCVGNEVDVTQYLVMEENVEREGNESPT